MTTKTAFWLSLFGFVVIFALTVFWGLDGRGVAVFTGAVTFVLLWFIMCVGEELITTTDRDKELKAKQLQKLEDRERYDHQN